MRISAVTSDRPNNQSPGLPSLACQPVPGNGSKLTTNGPFLSQLKPFEAYNNTRKRAVNDQLRHACPCYKSLIIIAHEIVACRLSSHREGLQ